MLHPIVERRVDTIVPTWEDDVVFERTLHLSSDTQRTLRIAVDPDTYRFSISSRIYGTPGAEWQTHATGCLFARAPGHEESGCLVPIAARRTQAILVGLCCLHFEKSGLALDPTFRGIAELLQNA